MSQSNAANDIRSEQTDQATSDSINLPDYIYQPLLPGEDTRVVRLLPSSDVESDIVCKIEHIGIGDDTNSPTVPYEALSYVCGPDHPAQLVRTVEGTKLSIRPHLLDALRLLRSSTAEIMIWVDQISVDQQNYKEREIQVRNFGRIFKRATSVSIVIRESNPSVPMIAFPFLFSLVKQMLGGPLVKQLLESRRTIHTNQYRRELLDEVLDLPPPLDSRWDAVNKFLENEGSFGPGHFKSSYLRRKGPIWTMSRESQHTRNYRIRGGTNVFRRIAAFRSIEFSRAIARTFPEKEITVPGASELGSMLQILKDLRSLKCFDYRDKIWTIIILANDYDVRTLPVDYQSPWESVYTKVCRWLCNRHRNLSFLQLVETKARKMQRGTDQNRPQGLPSWVPLFHVEPHFLNTFYLPRHIVRPKRSKIYYAGGSSQVICEEIATSETVFKCKGLKIGVITVLSYPAGNLENVGTGIGERVLHGGQWQALARTHCTPHDIYQPTKENVDLAFERLRTGDLFPENARRSRESVPTDLPQPSNFAVAYADLSSGSDQIFIEGDVSDIGNHIIRATTRRRMFITDTGYMGLTHQSNLVGDEIWVLMGADMPVTLHPVSTNTPGHCIGSECRTFEFREESYVHGIMDGEALVGARRKEDPDCPEGTSWLDDLGQESWPFSTEEIALI